MFEWIGDIIGGVGDFFGDAFTAIGDQISAVIWDTMLKWFYTAIYDAIAEFFTNIGNLGMEMFELDWAKAALRLFNLFGWGLFVVGLVVSLFDFALESQSGRTTIKKMVLNIVKGFFAASLITVLPLELYRFCVTLQNTFAGDLTRVFMGQSNYNISSASMAALTGGFAISGSTPANLFNILAMIALAYCVVKIFFAGIKRGGILFIQIAVGTLYIFSIPRGYTDGFFIWCKQIIALCLTAFLQTTLLFMGLLTFTGNTLLGIGIMLSAAEVPRIAQQFGLDTSAKFNVMSAVHATSTVVNMTKNITKAVAK